jgi:hypothetical protein
MQKTVGSGQWAVGSGMHTLCRRIVFYCLLLTASCLLPLTAQGQTVVDKMIATVNSGGVRPSLITYSDLLWQLALQPDTPLENPSTDNLTRALNLVISQRLILQEAEKLPAIEPTSKEIEDRLKEFIRMFPTQEEFYQRIARVGLYSDSEQFKEIVRQRLIIEKYLDFRFRSFTVVTQKEVEDYYRDVWVPRLRRQQPERLVPELKDVFKEVESELTENKIESDTDEFLDSARDRAEIVILDPAYRQTG